MNPLSQLKERLLEIKEKKKKENLVLSIKLIMYIDHCREPKANYLSASPGLHSLIKSHHSNPQPQKLSMEATSSHQLS